MMNKTLKGLLILGTGLVLLLNTLGILTYGLNGLIVVGSIALMLYGFLEMDGYNKLHALLSRVKIK